MKSPFELTSKDVKEVFEKHGVKVRVKNFKYSFRVVETKEQPLDTDVCVLAMRDLGLFNAFGRDDKFYTSQQHVSFIYKDRVSG